MIIYLIIFYGLDPHLKIFIKMFSEERKYEKS